MAEPGLFHSIARVNALKLFRAGRPDGERIVEFLDLAKRDVARAAKVPKESVRYDLRMPEVLRVWFETIGACIELVNSHFDDSDRTLLWFKTPNPLLGDVKPIDFVKMGRVRKLLAIIQSALSDNS